MTKPRAYLFLSFGDNATGRATVARQMAASMQRAGRRVHIVCGNPGIKSFIGSNLPVELLPPMPLLALYFEGLMEELNPAGVVFCDGNSVLRTLRNASVPAKLFKRPSCRVFGIDTWNSIEAGYERDLFGGIRNILEPWPKWLERIVTAPLARIGSKDNTCRGLMPAMAALPTARFAPQGRPKALITTAPWQHADFRNKSAAIVQRQVPSIVASCVRSVAGLHLLHVGPNRLPGFNRLKNRYQWLGNLPPASFERIMAQSRIYISLNPTSAAQTCALSLRVPVLLLQHSLDGPFPYRFRVWPLGYSRFLDPVLKNNPLMQAITVVELSQTAQVVKGLRDLAFKGAPRQAALERQSRYLRLVSDLPTPAARVIARCEGEAVTIRPYGDAADSDF